MPLTIKNVLEKLSDQWFASTEGRNDIRRKVIQDNLALILESIKENMPIPSNTDGTYTDGFCDACIKVINIINSHKI